MKILRVMFLDDFFKDCIVKDFDYEIIDSGIKFKDDIIIPSKKWKIDKIIRHTMTTRNVQYDNGNYLEFCISDQHNEIRIIKFFYYCLYDHKGNIYWNIDLVNEPSGMCNKYFRESGNLPIEESIKFFLEQSSIFQCIDWEDFDTQRSLEKIQRILKNGCSKQSKLQDIKKVLDNH